MKTVVQCDFDGTVTVGEVSRLLLEEFAEGDWISVGKEYTGGKISVQTCNIIQFAMVKIDEKTMKDFLLNSGRVEIRPGFPELVEYSRKRGFDFVFVSNGLQFYIETILENLNIGGVEVYAAQSEFSPKGMKLTYPGPDGTHVEGFKEKYAEILRNRGYDKIYYVGNGVSDIYPARLADHVFAIDGLLEQCRKEKMEYFPFNDLFDVIKGIEATS
jgi:2-hydroxy-3-keto-5-methylthiopentenyl-1-phosphate phosphatase